MKTRIRIVSDPLNFIEEYELISLNNYSDGAIVTFHGKVRNCNLNENILKLTLEHYSGMTEKILEEIVLNARKRWQLQHVTVIHRVGELNPGDVIVFIGVSSVYRKTAFLASEFIMDCIKIYAPFWKRESTKKNSYWIDLRDSDIQEINRWK